MLKFSLVPASKKVFHSLVGLFLESLLEVSRDSTSLWLTQSVSQCLRVFLSLFLAPSSKLKELISKSFFLLDILKLFASSSFDLPTSQTPFYVILSGLYSSVLSPSTESLSAQTKAKRANLEVLVSSLHYSLIEVVCQDSKLFSISPPKESIEFFNQCKQAIQNRPCFLNQDHLLSILKSLNHLSDATLVFRKLSFFADLFAPLSFRELVLSTLPQIESLSPLSTFSRIHSVISPCTFLDSPDPVSTFWSQQRILLSGDFYPRLFGLFLFENYSTLELVLTPSSATFPLVLDHLFTSELLSTVPKSTFFSISKFLLSSSLSTVTFKHIQTGYLERIDLYNRSFGKLRLLVNNLYSFLKQAPASLLRSLFNANTCFTLFYNIDKMFSNTKVNRGLSSKFALVLNFLCKLGILDMQFFYNNLANPRFPSYSKSFAKFIACLLNPSKRTFPLICVSGGSVLDSSSLESFVQVFSEQVDRHNNDLPILITFLQICLDTKLSFPGLAGLFLPIFLPKFSHEPLGKVQQFLTSLAQLDSNCLSPANSASIHKFLETFDFDQENQFEVVTSFYLDVRDKFGVDLSLLQSGINTSLQRMVQQLPFDLDSIRSSSPEAVKVRHFINRIIRIAFETSELFLLKHLFHIFMNKYNPFFKDFSSSFLKVASDSNLADQILLDYVHDLIDRVLLHSDNLFPEPFYHRLNIFRFILVPTLNLLQTASLISIFSFYYSDWVRLLRSAPPSLVSPSDATLSAAYNLFLRQHMILSILSIVYKRLDKNEILQKLYPTVLKPEQSLSIVTKELIGCVTSLEQSLDTVHQILSQLSLHRSGFTRDLLQLTCHVHSFHLRASLFACLSSILMKTQSKLSIISDFLIFNRKSSNHRRLLKFLPPSFNLNFGVKTTFEIQSLDNLGPSLTKSFKSSLMSQNFLAFQPKTPKLTESTNPIEKSIDKENSIELDQINQLPITLELIDLFSSIVFQFKLEKETAIHSFAEILKAADLPLHHRVILLKIILNNPAHFENHKELFLPSLLDYLGVADTGGAGMHYFLRDVLSLFCDWVAINPLVLSTLPNLKISASRAVKKVISKLADKSRSILCHNFSLCVKLIDCVHEFLSVDLSFLIKMLSIKEPLKKEQVSKSKLEDLRLWKYVGLCVLEALVLKNINVVFQTQEGPINSKNSLVAREVLNTLLSTIKGNSSRYLAIKSAFVLGLFLRFNEWVLLKSELSSMVSTTIFSLNSKSYNFQMSILNQLSFYFPQIFFKEKHVPIFLQNSARTINNKSVYTFLSCILNLFEFGEDLSQEFSAHPVLVKTLFTDLVHFLDKTFSSSGEFFVAKMIVILLKKFLVVPFADKPHSVKHLIEKLAQIDLFSLSYPFRAYLHSLIIDTAHYIMTEEKKTAHDMNKVPSLASLGSKVMTSINESFQRIERLHFSPHHSQEEEAK